MVTKNYMAILADVKCADPNGNVFNGIWQSYERVVLHSLVTSFGLDFLVQDQQGGDVDNIRSVRSSGFKSDEHRAAYEARGGYDTRAYHTHPQYFEIAQSARRTFNETGEMQQDAYVSGNTVAYSRASALGKDRRANLDHVISAHEIHEDPGRVLAGLDGRDLANSPENLRFTNESLNKSKSDMTVEEFLDKKGVSVPEDVQQQMRAVDQEARDAYNAKLEAAYYTSSDFWGDAIAAAGARGIEMGARQALGFIFVEVWFACKEEMLAVPDNCEIKDYYTALERGVKRSIENTSQSAKGCWKASASDLWQDRWPVLQQRSATSFLKSTKKQSVTCGMYSQQSCRQQMCCCSILMTCYSEIALKQQPLFSAPAQVCWLAQKSVI